MEPERICAAACQELKGFATKQYIRHCLDDKFKREYERKLVSFSTTAEELAKDAEAPQKLEIVVGSNGIYRERI